jgi:hypothetical protein
MFGARLFLLQVFTGKVLKNGKGAASVSGAQVCWQAIGFIGFGGFGSKKRTIHHPPEQGKPFERMGRKATDLNPGTTGHGSRVAGR